MATTGARLASVPLAEGSPVWIPHESDGYTLAHLEKLAGSTASVVIDAAKKDVAVDGVYPAAPDKHDGVEDNTQLMYLYEPHLLDNLRIRYGKDSIYTYTALILIAINPYKRLPVYDNTQMIAYRGKSIGILPPHVFALADRAYRDMKATKRNQSIIVSGESGAGKTESCKFVMRYLAAVGGDLSLGDLEVRIIEANPLLESFGNAKTTRNNNSSRFGKFTEIHFDDQARVVGASIATYVLEKSRIVSQAANERNYHVFYELCAGATEAERAEFRLQPASGFAYLNQGNAVEITGVDDAEGYQRLKHAMTSCGMTAEEQHDIMRVVAGVLHLGNIPITAARRGEGVAIEEADANLQAACALLGCPPADLLDRLSNRFVKIKTEKNTLRTPFKLVEAVHARDALAKAIYARLFDTIVARVNRSLPFQHSASFIGVLDIAGFEFFQNNSFEQFCINYANEKLQQHFNIQILQQEQEIYEKEGIRYTKIDFVDNQDTIDLMENAQRGILGILDEESRIPDASDKRFCTHVHAQHGRHARLMNPKKFTGPNGKKFNESEAFVIKHFAGDVCYNAEGFLDKNSDPLHDCLQELLVKSSQPFMASMFVETDDAGVKKKKTTVGGKFRTQLNELMSTLRNTTSNFIRCVKPNPLQRPDLFHGYEIMHQLRCSGMMEALQLMQGGYPTRCPFEALYNRYKDLMPDVIARLPPAQFCEALLYALDLDRNDFQLGLTRVFFRAGKMAFLDRITGDSNISGEIVQRVKRWLARKRFRRLIFTVVSALRANRRIEQMRAVKKLGAILVTMHVLSTGLLPRAVASRTHRAATRIQAAFRCIRLRRDFVRKRAAAKALQPIIKGFVVYRRMLPQRRKLKEARLAREKLEAEAKALRLRLEEEARREAERQAKLEAERLEREKIAARERLEQEAKNNEMARRILEERTLREEETGRLIAERKAAEAALGEQMDKQTAAHRTELEAQRVELEQRVAREQGFKQEANAANEVLAKEKAALTSELAESRDAGRKQALRIEELEASLAELTREHHATVEEGEKRALQLRRAETEVTALHTRVEELEEYARDAAHLANEHRRVLRETEELKSQLEELRENFADVDGQRAKFKRQAEDQSSQIKALEFDVQQANAARTKLKHEVEELTEELTVAKSKARRERPSSMMLPSSETIPVVDDRTKARLVAAEEELATFKSANKRLADEAIEATRRVATERAGLEEMVVRLERELKTSHASNEDLEAVKNRYVRKIKTLEDEVDEMRNAHLDDRDKLRKKEEQCQNLEAEMEGLRNRMEDNQDAAKKRVQTEIIHLREQLVKETDLKLRAEGEARRLRAELESAADNAADGDRSKARMERNVKRLEEKVTELEKALEAESEARRVAERTAKKLERSLKTESLSGGSSLAALRSSRSSPSMAE